jgi:hypothetical protein
MAERQRFLGADGQRADWYTIVPMALMAAGMLCLLLASLLA